MPLITGNLRPRISLGPAPYLLAVIFLIGAAIAVLARRKGRGNVALAGLMAPMALTILLSVRLLAPSFQEGHQKVLREISEAASAQLGPDGLLVAYDLNAPSLVFYARRQVLRVGRCEEARIQQLAASHRRLLIVSKAAAEPSLMKVQGIFPLDRRGGYVLYSNHLRR